MDANIPDKAAGKVTLNVVSILVAPNARDPSRKCLGTACQASSDILAINGKTIIPTTTAPLRGLNSSGSSSI